jgi:hypothetical protein
MDHAEYRRRIGDDTIRVHIDESKVGCFYARAGLIPADLRRRPAIIRAAACAGMAAGGLLFLAAPWWLSLLVLFAGLALFPRAHRAAVDGLRQAALADPRVFDLAHSQRVLIVSERNPSPSEPSQPA